ncbi:alpha/beta hydrolase [Nocardia aurea]|uniref:alpha/beta hydrolase n=2 Tax=Nocardia TaxID=1817 RepID=UPI000D689A3A
MVWTRTRTAVVVTAVAMACGMSVGGASADSRPPDPVLATGSMLASPNTADGSRVGAVTVDGDRTIRLAVYSAAMDRDIQVDVQRPADTSAPRPTLYLLNGAGGGEDSATWKARSDVMDFLADKDVNVVTPVGGAWSYYTDWIADDPVLGRNKWQTFLTRELPPLIDAGLGTNSVNAIAGISMAGTSVLQLPIAAPGLYRSAAAYSGCAQISDPVGYNFANTVVAAGGGNSANMYGPAGDPGWAANDPYVHAEGLRGVNLYLSDGSGVPGKYDTLDGPNALPGVGGLVNQVAVGGALEAATDYCSRNMRAELDRLGIPATYHFASTGTHSWGYWQDELKRSWPVLAHGLGLPA